MLDTPLIPSPLYIGHTIPFFLANNSCQVIYRGLAVILKSQNDQQQRKKEKKSSHLHRQSRNEVKQDHNSGAK